jgi:hypothetical protein
VEKKLQFFGLKREHPALQNMKFRNFLFIFVGSFYPPGSGSGSTDLIESGSNPDPKHCQQRLSYSEPQNYSIVRFQAGTSTEFLKYIFKFLLTHEEIVWNCVGRN